MHSAELKNALWANGIHRKCYQIIFDKNEHFFVEIPPYCSWRVTDPYHRHDNFYELVVVFSGTAVDDYRQSREVLRSGNVLMYAPHSAHRYVSRNHFQNYNVLFDETFLEKCKPFLENMPLFRKIVPRGGERSPLFMLPENDLAAVIGMLESLHEEYIMQQANWEDVCGGEFIRILQYVFRHIEPPENSSVHPSTFQIGRIIRYMENNLEKELPVTDLAKLCGMSVSGFRQLFKSVTACSPVEYLLRLKMKKALLMLPVIPRVDDLARLCGFADYNYFCRQFRRHFGVSPLTARKKLISKEYNLQTMLNKMICRDSE